MLPRSWSRTGTLRSESTRSTPRTRTLPGEGRVLHAVMNWKSRVDPLRGKMTWLEQGLVDVPGRAQTRLRTCDGAYKLTLSAQRRPLAGRAVDLLRVPARYCCACRLQPGVQRARVPARSTILRHHGRVGAGRDHFDPADGLWFYRHIFTDNRPRPRRSTPRLPR